MSNDRHVPVDSILPIGRCCGTALDVVAGELSTIAADLAIVGICSRTPAGAELATAVEGLDHAMHGAIARLRADGIFAGKWGETLFLSSPPAPIKAKGVLLLGLGPTGRSVASHTRRALRSAANQAVRLSGGHAAFAPARLVTGGTRFEAAASTRAILRGIIDVLNAQPGRLERWSFVAPPAEAAVLADEFRMAFALVWEQ